MKSLLWAFFVTFHQSDAFAPQLPFRHKATLQQRLKGGCIMNNPLTAFIEQASEQLESLMQPATKSASSVIDYDPEIEAAKEILRSASETKAENGDVVVNALLDLEKLQRAKARVDDSVAAETLAGLEGAWRLVFTTGTLDTQKKIKGRINYFPLKAVQCFDAEGMRITNSVYLFGETPLIKFFGPWSFNPMSRKVEFDFTSIAVLGFKFDLPKGGAADFGAATGLGSDNNKELVNKGKKPFFNWISADKEIATARGGGGGLALWRRDLDIQAANAADPNAF